MMKKNGKRLLYTGSICIAGFFIWTVLVPILIGGVQEASYPSSTTLLVLGVVPILMEQVGRLLSGVHWLTDIVGAVMLSTGLVCIYQAAVLWCDKNKN